MESLLEMAKDIRSGRRRACGFIITEHLDLGDVIYLRVLSQPIIVLNSREAMQVLLDGKSAIYSSRPHLALLSKDWYFQWSSPVLSIAYEVGRGGFDWSMPMLKYGEELQLQRRLMNQCMNPIAYKVYEDIMHLEALRCAQEFSVEPEGYKLAINRYAMISTG